MTSLFEQDLASCLPDYFELGGQEVTVVPVSGGESYGLRLIFQEGTAGTSSGDRLTMPRLGSVDAALDQQFFLAMPEDAGGLNEGDDLVLDDGRSFGIYDIQPHAQVLRRILVKER